MQLIFVHCSYWITRLNSVGSALLHMLWLGPGLFRLSTVLCFDQTSAWLRLRGFNGHWYLLQLLHTWWERWQLLPIRLRNTWMQRDEMISCLLWEAWEVKGLGWGYYVMNSPVWSVLWTGDCWLIRIRLASVCHVPCYLRVYHCSSSSIFIAAHCTSMLLFVAVVSGPWGLCYVLWWSAYMAPCIPWWTAPYVVTVQTIVLLI